MSNLARTQRRDNHEIMAEIFNFLDRSTESRFLELLEERSKESADRVRALMFTFEDLLKLDGAGVQMLLRNVDNSKLGLALKGASEKLRELFFANMSERAAKILRDDMETMGPVRLRDVEEAQMMLVNTAKDLAAAGEIFIADGKDDDDAGLSHDRRAFPFVTLRRRHRADGRAAARAGAAWRGRSRRPGSATRGSSQRAAGRRGRAATRAAAAAYGEDELAAAVAAARQRGRCRGRGRGPRRAAGEPRAPQAAALAALGAQLARLPRARSSARSRHAPPPVATSRSRSAARWSARRWRASRWPTSRRCSASSWCGSRASPGSRSACRPTLAAAAEKSLLAIAEEAGYRGALRVLPEPRLGPGDARLSWQDGAAERDLGRARGRGRGPGRRLAADGEPPPRRGAPESEA